MHVRRYRGIVADMGRERDEWIDALRKAGVKAAHPDDGWVDRVSNRVLLLWCGRATQDDLEHAIRTCAPRQAMVAWDEIRRRARLAR